MEETVAPSPPTDIPSLPDLTGQISVEITDYVAAGGFGSVYKCDWRPPTSTQSIKVAVKIIRCPTSEQDKVALRRLQREARIWAYLSIHENIVPLYGTINGLGRLPALVSLWFPHGTLHRLIADKVISLSTRSKLNLLHDIACGLDYLHKFPIVHGDLTSSNVLIDLKGGEYKASLTDFGLSTVLGGLLHDPVVQASTCRSGAIRWAAPELICHPAGGVKPTKQNDMYSFGRTMFHVLTQIIPWGDLDDYQVIQKINGKEEIKRPEMSHATSDLTDARWNKIELCWSVKTSARPSASMVMAFLESELLTLTDVDIPVGGAQESRVPLGMGLGDAIGTAAPSLTGCSSSTAVELEGAGSLYTHVPHETDKMTLSSSSAVSGLQTKEDQTTASPILQSLSQFTPSRIDNPPIFPQPSSQFDLPPTFPQPPIPPDSNSAPARPLTPLSRTPTLDQVKPFNSSPNPVTLHQSATVSSLSVPGPLNVLIFGETGVGKSSVINLILRKPAAQISADAPTCTLEDTPYEINLGNHHFRLWEVSSIAPMNFFRRFYAKWNLKRKFKKLFKGDGVHLLLYCMRNSRAQGTMLKDYKFFTKIVGSTAGRIPVAAVVTCLEDYSPDMDDWWTKNEDNLGNNGMIFSRHACITALPDDPSASSILRSRQQRSQEIIRELICGPYQPGRAPA